MSIEIRVPALGESITEATVGKWFRQTGEAVKADEPLVELETDKVTVEVPAPASGVLGDILVKSGSTVAVGSLLAALKEGATKNSATPSPGPSKAAPQQPPPPEHATTRPAASASRLPSPRASKAASELRISVRRLPRSSFHATDWASRVIGRTATTTGGCLDSCTW